MSYEAPSTPRKAIVSSNAYKSPIKSGLTDMCAICLGSMQTRSVLNNCVHSFCFECISQWGSSFVTNCPICKTNFTSISFVEHSNVCLTSTSPILPVLSAQKLVEQSPSSRVTLRQGCKCEIKQKEFEPKQPQAAIDPAIDQQACQVCFSGDNDDVLLLCDGCNAGYHTYCMNPPQDTIPENEWFCTVCTLEIQRLIEEAQARRKQRTSKKKANASGAKRSRVRIVLEEMEEDEEYVDAEDMERRVDSVRQTRSRTRSHAQLQKSNRRYSTTDSDHDEEEDYHAVNHGYDQWHMSSVPNNEDVDVEVSIVKNAAINSDCDTDDVLVREDSSSCVIASTEILPTPARLIGRTMYMDVNSDASTESIPSLHDLLNRPLI